jgi:hypothetical protein
MSVQIKDETKKPDEEITLTPGKITNVSNEDMVVLDPNKQGTPVHCVADKDFLHPVTHEVVVAGDKTTLPPKMFSDLYDKEMVSDPPAEKSVKKTTSTDK